MKNFLTFLRKNLARVEDVSLPPFMMKWLAAFAVGLCVYFVLHYPNTTPTWEAESHAAFTKAAHAVTINDSPTHPIQLWYHTTKETAPPLIINVQENQFRVFESFPLTATNYAVVLSSLHDAGISSLSISQPLTWNAEQETISKIALDQQLIKFDHCITSAALTLGATEAEMPAAFVRSSLPISAAKGNIAKVTRVNRLAMPDVALENTKTQAGFSKILTEQNNTPYVQVMALWNDRIVFSHSFLTLLTRSACTLEKIQIVSGSHILIPTSGQFIMLDDFGRTPLRQFPTSTPTINAEDTLTASGLLKNLSKENISPVVLLDYSNKNDAARSKQEILSLLHTPLARSDDYSRYSTFTEIFIIGLLSLLVSAPYFFTAWKKIALILCIVLGYYLLSRFSLIILPIFPVLAACVAQLIYQMKHRFSHEPIIVFHAPIAEAKPAIQLIQEKMLELTPEQATEEPVKAPAKKRAPRKKKIVETEEALSLDIPAPIVEKPKRSPRKKAEPKDPDAPKPERKKRTKKVNEEEPEQT